MTTTEHTGVTERVYVHVGTGATPSTTWCDTCQGYYGMPHQPEDHDHPPRQGCACRACQTATGRYPHGGQLMTTSEFTAYLATIENAP